MIPANQSEIAGNCFAACVASILEVQIDQVPDCRPQARKLWYDRLNDWLRGFDLQLCFGEVPPCAEAFVIATGPGPRGCRHAVVWRNGKMVHDPHPSRAGLERMEEYWFFVAIDPRIKGQI